MYCNLVQRRLCMKYHCHQHYSMIKEALSLRFWSPRVLEGSQMSAQFIDNDIKNWFYKKNSNFFNIFFSVFWIPSTNKKIFCTYFFKLSGQHVHLAHPPKMLFRGLFYKVSLKRPPYSTLTFLSQYN